MGQLDLQQFILKAGESGLVNLNVTMGDLVKSEAFGMLQGYDEPWEGWCASDFRFMFWHHGPRLDENVIDQEIVASVHETLNIVNEIKTQIGTLKG